MLKNRIRPSVFLLALIFTLALFLPTPVSAQTYKWDGVCVGHTPNSESVATIQGLECLIANVFVVFIGLVGLAGFLMFVFGAFRWLLSGGESKAIQTARGAMTHAVIGLVVALSAFIIINLLAEFTGVNAIKSFRIPTSDVKWSENQWSK